MAENPEKKVAHMKEEKKDEIMQNFQYFKDYLGDKVEMGEKIGLDDDQLTKYAKKVADYLAKQEKPRNREEYLLNEMWNVANEKERENIAHVLVKMVDRTND
ncbi:DUF3243 domain-containing protein [Halalkalibacillus sediminis]|uniref:DUF3243 domain-containing protein n=1 Tax=Halalkalibacillus sediminis TaxID=2018042 RepID=A0A2I0QSA8_9BACI|nr:DUF3243 domain-containing protein [Halalkalibacillus sediminis]PKR77194.1 DUF3243 domain-containing protein [Halalkalibacillus sediminis]